CVMFYLARRAFLLFFYLLLLRSPLPTLFPYTTLFRSTALVLYGQNAKGFLKNAAWLLVFTYGLTFLVFLLLLAPAGAIVYFMPGGWASAGFLFALIFAWAIKASLVVPFAITCLLQAYFKLTAGQSPDPQWEERLAQASDKFRELSKKAGEWVASNAADKGVAAAATSAPATAETKSE